MTEEIFSKKLYKSTNKYNSVKYIPTNTKYNLNSSKSNCRNELSESILADILYEDGYIIINTTEVAICDVYLDRE